MADPGIQREIIEECLISQDRISIARLANKGNLYLNLEKQYYKTRREKRRNADIEPFIVRLISKKGSVGYIIADLMTYGNLEARDLYSRIIEVLEDNGTLEEKNKTGKPAPAIFDSAGKQIAFSSGYGPSNS